MFVFEIFPTQKRPTLIYIYENFALKNVFTTFLLLFLSRKILHISHFCSSVVAVVVAAAFPAVDTVVWSAAWVDRVVLMLCTIRFKQSRLELLAAAVAALAYSGVYRSLSLLSWCSFSFMKASVKQFCNKKKKNHKKN